MNTYFLRDEELEGISGGANIGPGGDIKHDTKQIDQYMADNGEVGWYVTIYEDVAKGKGSDLVVLTDPNGLGTAEFYI